MMLLKLNAMRSLLSVEKLSVTICQTAGLQDFKPLKPKLDIEWPEKNKLPQVLKQPIYPTSMRPFKMQKRLRYMRGPEPIHTELLHKQFGIIAIRGGRMRYEHFEVIRMTLLRRCNFNKMFAIWRVDPPWQPLTKKSQGQRMGSGKGPIDHYVTPVKAGRVIVEVGGNIEYFEVKTIMKNIANKMPFPAKAVEWSELEREREREKELEEKNINPWTWEYIIKNNIGGCHNWISPFDKKWFNKYL